MDVKILARFITALGIVVLSYGAFRLATNQPERFDQSKSERSVFGGRDDIGNYLQMQMRNSDREVIRHSATKAIVAGAIVAFLGIAVTAAARRPTTSTPVVPESNAHPRRAGELSANSNEPTITADSSDTPATDRHKHIQHPTWTCSACDGSTSIEFDKCRQCGGWRS